MLDNHSPQAFGGCADRGSEPGRACADHRNIEDLAGRDRGHDAEGVGDLGVGGVDQRWPPGPEPEHDHRQVRGGQAEFSQHLQGALGGGVVRTAVRRENRSRSSCDRADHRWPITCTGSKPPPRWLLHSLKNERIWGALKNYVANTAVTWPGRLRQIHSFFRARSPDEMLDTAAPWTSPWLPPGYEQNFWNAA